MRKIEMFGKKVPIIAVFVMVLMITTASAAIFAHYATLTGDIEVMQGVSVSDHNTDPIQINGSGELLFTSPATFVINNGYEVPVLVNITTTVTMPAMTGADPDDYEGIYVDYTVLADGEYIEAHESPVTVIVPPGGLTVDVDFTFDPLVFPGTYGLQVEVDPYLGTETYDEYMEGIYLIHKNNSWVEIGEPKVEVDFVAMGNDFYYELSVTNATPETEYGLIYYGDGWPGDHPGAVIEIVTTDVNGDVSLTTGHVNLNMNLPDPEDANYPDGAKLWMVPTIYLSNDNTTLPMDGWDQSANLYEHALISYVDTNIM